MKTNAAKFLKSAGSANSLPATDTDQQGTKKALDAYNAKRGLKMDCSAWKRRKTA